MNDLLVLVQGPLGKKRLAAHLTRDGILVVLEVGLECGAAVETLVTLFTFYLLPVTDILMDFQVSH